MIYADTCALIKLIHLERETDALLDWLRLRPDERIVTSVLAEIEVPRALRRSGPKALGMVPGVMGRVDRFEIDAPVRATAAAYVDENLRSLDAIHLATAENLLASGQSVSCFVTYDKRLAAAAAEFGFDVASPGA